MRHADFSRVLAAEGVSNFGSMLSRLAIPWLAALQLNATPAQMALLLLADVTASALGALWLGAWVERQDKRAVMLLADGVRAALLLGLALLAARGGLSVELLALAAAASGLATVAFELARSAWIAQRIAAPELPRRNAQLSVAGSVSEAAAFALGGWLYQGLGAAWALAVDGLSYLLSALCLRRVRSTPSAVDTSAATTLSSLVADASQGLRAVAAHPTLRALTVVHALLAFSLALFGTSFMIFVSRDLGLPTGELGLIFALGGLGSVAGASLASRLGRKLGPGTTMTVGLTMFALGLACAPAAQGSGWVAIVLLALQQIVGDSGHSLHDVHDRSLRQSAVPHDLLARVDAGIRSAGHFATLAGALIGGALGTAEGARTVLWLAVASALMAALWAGLRLARAA